MKTFLLTLLTIIITGSSAIAVTYASDIPSQTVCGRKYTNLTNLIHLQAYVADSTNKYGSFRKDGGSAGYSPSGVSFRITCITLTHVITTAGTPVRMINLLYSDNDLGVAGTTTPTNPVHIGGSSNFTIGVAGNNNQVGVRLEYPVNFVIPSGKYGGIIHFPSGTGNITAEAWGYEE